MRKSINGLLTILALSGIFIFLPYCGDPVKPNFENPPEIGNGKQIGDFGTHEYKAFYGMYISVTGPTPITYQWQKNSIEITGATKDTIIFPSLAFSDSGVYICIAKNQYGSDTSLSCTLSVSIGDGIAPEILNGKQIFHSDTACIDSLYLMYINAIGTEPLHYQWLKDGDSLVGDTGDTLVIAVLAYADSGFYTCHVQNDYGNDVSLNDTLKFVIVNNPPMWSVDTMHVSVYENETCSLTLSDSCTDPEGDSIIYSMGVQSPATDSIIADSYTYTPSFSEAGVYDVIILASDGNTSDSVVLHIVVINQNRAPEFLDSLPDDNYYVNEGGLLTIAFEAVDPDNDSVFYLLQKSELPGTVTFSDSQLVWQSTNDDSGYYSVEIAASDGVDTTIAPAITIAVGDVNRPPVIAIDTLDQGDTVAVKEMDTLKLTVTVDDPDQGNQPVLLTPANLPVGASFDTATGLLSWIPVFSVSDGLNNQVFDSVTFFATDNVNAFGHDTFFIAIEVLDSNSAPVWTVDTATLTVTEGSPVSIDFSALFAGDNEGDAVTFTTQYGAFNGDTTVWSWTPDFTAFHDAGDTTCVITAADNHVPPASASCTLNVIVVDSTPAVSCEYPTSVTYNSVQISWSQSSDPDFTSYKMYYDTDVTVDETSNLAGEITNISTTSLTISSLSENTRYYARVFVYNSHLSKAGSNVVDTVTSFLEPPALTITAPVFTNDTAVIDEAAVTQITGSATSHAGISSVSALVNGTAATVSGTGSWSITLSSFPKKQFNTVAITATDSAGKTTDTTVYIFIKPTLSPSTIQVASSTTSSIALSWTQVDSCDSYILYRSDDSTTFTVVKDTAALAYTDNLVEMGKKYFYKVKGYYQKDNITDTSDFSNTVKELVKSKFEKLFPFYTFNTPNGTKVMQAIDGGYVITGYYDGGGILLKLNGAGEKVWCTENYIDNGIRKFLDVAYSQDNNAYIILAVDTAEHLFVLKSDLNGSISSTEFIKLNTINYTFDCASLIRTSDGGYIVWGSSSDYSTHTSKLSETLSLEWEKNYGLEFGRSCNRGVEVDDGYVINCYCANGFLGIFKMSLNGDSLFFETSGSVFSNGGIAFNSSNNECFMLGHDYNDNNLVLFKYENVSGTLNKEYEKTLTFEGPDRDIIHTSDGGYMILSSTDQDSLTYLYKLDALANSTPQWSKTIENKANVKRIIQASDNGYVIIGSKVVGSDKNIYVLKVDENGEMQ